MARLKELDKIKLSTSLSLEHRDKKIFFIKNFSPSKLVQTITKLSRNKQWDSNLTDIWAIATDGRFKPEDFN